MPHRTPSPSSQQEKLEEQFNSGLNLLRELSEGGVPVIVEGLKDVTALRGLGLSGPIHSLAGHSVVTLADELIGNERILILFDFDRRGNQLTGQLIAQLEGRGVDILHDVRRKLARAFIWRVRVVEGLKPLNKSSKATRL